MKNQPGTWNNQPGTLKNHKNWPGPMKKQPKTWKTIENDMELWKTNPNCERSWKPTWSCTGWLRVITGGYRRLPGGSDHFSWQTDRQMLHHNIYIIIIITKPKATNGRQGQGWDGGARIHFGRVHFHVFPTSSYLPTTALCSDWILLSNFRGLLKNSRLKIHKCFAVKLKKSE